MLTIIGATVAALATLVAGQASSTVPPSMPPSATTGFDIAPVGQQERFQWCLAQTNNCPKICGGSPDKNSCEESDLSWSCVCSNGTVPDVSAYEDTVPFYICQQTFVQCIKANPDDAQGQKTCKENQKCGSANATSSDSSDDSSDSSDSAKSSATSAAASASGSASAASSPSATTTSNPADTLPQQLATGSLAAIFAIALALL